MVFDLQELYRTNPRKACQLALRRTIGTKPWNRLETINTLLSGFGVVPLQGEWYNGYWGDIAGGYINMGDPYSTTVVELRTGYSKYDRRFSITSWGDLVERDHLGSAKTAADHTRAYSVG